MIVIASQQGAIRVADRTMAAWYGSEELVGTSILGLVAPPDRLAALRLIEHLVENPGAPCHLALRLVQPTGAVSAFDAFGALVGGSVAVQLTRCSHAVEQLDESLIWITPDMPEIGDPLRQPVMAMVAGAVGGTVPGTQVVRDYATASVFLPRGTTLADFDEAHRTTAERACFLAQLGDRLVAVRSDVTGVHFGRSGLTTRVADGNVTLSAGPTR